jgi:site-specific recombinase XerD
VVYGLNRLSDDLDFDNQAGLDLDQENLAQYFHKAFGYGDASAPARRRRHFVTPNQISRNRCSSGLGKTARKALWRYLVVDREDGDFPAAPLFTNKSARRLNKDALRQVINALGAKAGIKPCYPHRFRHTFAITYLRSGGDLFTLKSLLGHSSLDMVEHYARVAEVDV